MNPIDDPRIRPKLQRLCDETFAALLAGAARAGLQVTTLPFDILDEDIGNKWKELIAESLAAVMGPA